jgi:uncharacterized protein YegL
MQGSAIEALNEGLRTFKEHLLQDALALRRVEIAAVAFDSDIRIVQDFVIADQFTPPTLTAQGLTCGLKMPAGIPHGPFFWPLFRFMASGTPTQEAQAQIEALLRHDGQSA